MLSIRIFPTTVDKWTWAYIWSHLIWVKTVFSEDYKQCYAISSSHCSFLLYPNTPHTICFSNSLDPVRYEVLRVVLLKIQVFWNVTLCLRCVVPDIWKTMVPSPSRVNLLGMLINEEDETTFLQNSEHQPPKNTKSKLTRPESSPCTFFH